jgi:signal transduction histidine kinase
LRTPLNVILGFSELILDQTPGPLDERCVDYTREIQQSGHRLLGAVNDLIAISQLESGSYELKEEHVEVERIIQACLCGAGIRAREANVRIETFNQAEAVTLRADVTALVQALLNVMTNAVKFTPAGGNVSWRAEIAASGELVFVVKDTGIGIDQAVLPRIFEPFYQADSSNTRRFSGSGLGLAISRKLVMLHGGSLDVQSRPRHGTTVQIILPAERVLGAQRQAAAPASPSIVAATSRPRSAASRSSTAARGVAQTSRVDITDGF